MRSVLLATVLIAFPAGAQVHHRAPAVSPSPQPTRVVVRSGRLVTARTQGGGTQSFNCRAPQNARKPVCRHAR